MQKLYVHKRKEKYMSYLTSQNRRRYIDTDIDIDINILVSRRD